MKNKFNTATFLRQLTLTLLVAMLAAAFQPARAQESQVEYPEYITDVKLIGGSETTINTLKTQYEAEGWIFVDYDLNDGCTAATADRIYLLYKKGNRNSTDGGYITDLKVSKFDWVESLNVTIDNNTYTYKYCPFDGDESFKSNNGDLNSNKVGNALHLYYTKQNFPDKRALASIWVNADNGIPESAPDGIAYNQYLTVCYTSNTAEVNLNSGVNGGGNIVMHYATNTKTNRPSSDPVAVENLTYNGNPQELITFSDDNTNTGTMMYRVGTSGDFSSNIPTATEVDNYTVYYYADANDYGDQSATKSLTVSIAPLPWTKDDDNNYLIKSADNLNLLSTYVNSGHDCSGMSFKVTEDIDFNPQAGEENNFTAIGTFANPFKGTFDGGNNNGYTISGIRINASSGYQGLFGYVGRNATIQNVTLEDAEITCSRNYVGGIVGNNNYGKISNCTSRAKVSATGSACYYYGGIVGRNYGTISNCTSSATVSSSGIDCHYYGGIVGENDGTISNCTSSATVSASGDDCWYYGGIVGMNYGEISKCTSSATVSTSGNGSRYGGIAGNNYGTLTNNLAIYAVISSSGNYGAITGSNSNTLTNNFYYNTTVNGVNNTTNAGCNGADIPDDNGAVSVHTITLCDGLSITADPSITYDQTDYYAQGTVLELKKNIATTYYANGEEISGETFTMPAENVTFTRDYFITYTLNGGALPEGTANPKIFTAESGEITLPTPTRDVFDFIGWFNNENFEGDPITSIDPASTHNDVNLYAKWTLITITEIYSTDDLIKFSASVNAGNTYKDKTVKLMNSINFNPQAGEDNNFTAIGTKDHPFNGTFEGGNNNGYTISGIRINSSTYYQGLFGYVESDATIQNVTLEDAEITCSGKYVGGIVGNNNYGKISNCTSSATVSASGYYCDYYGGIVGSNNYGKISNCTSRAKVSATGNDCDYYGGIAGYNNGEISSCTSSATVSASGTHCYYNGGIAGVNDGILTNNLAIDAVISSSVYYGAIAGHNGTLQNNFYYNCTVNGVNNATNVGCNGADITDDNGAVSVHTITLCDGLSITADPSITYDQTDYYAQGTVLELKKNIATTYYANGEEISGETFTMPAENVTFTRDYFITYTLNGGALPEGTANPKIFTAESGEITLPTPTRDVFDFIGWFNNENFEGDPITSIDPASTHNDVNLYAKWTLITITEIYSTDDLIKFSASVNAGNTYKDKTVKLMNSINFNPQAGEDNNFTAIGTEEHPFNGTFDGGGNNGYTISGIRINASTNYQGLFGYVESNATIQNVTIENAEITCSDNYVGGIAGKNYGTISNCTSSAKVSSSGDDCSYYGGIVGLNYGTLTNNLAIYAVISSSGNHGAIASYNSQNPTNNYYYNCTVNGVNNATNVGCDGADITENNGAVSVHTITLCDGLSITTNPSITYDQTDYYAQGTVLELKKNIATTYYANGEEISGETFTMPAENVTFTRDYFITYTLNGGALPEGTANPKIFTAESGEITLPTPTRDVFDFIGWFNNENFEGDPITSIDPASTHNDVNLYAKWTLITITEIYSTDDLIKFSASVNAGNTYKDKTVKLMNSINFNPQAGEDNNFTAIGTKDHPFNGTFEGGNNNGYTISGIRINASTDYQGLFGYVGRNATIQNVTLEDAEITCSVDYVGGIAGENDGKISNCTSSAKVSSSGDDCSYYGGIAGENDGTILYCTSSATVSSSENSCIRYGGIVGCNYGTISNCTSRAKVSSSGTPCFLYGGIAGDNSGTITNNLAIDAVISNEYLYGAIAGSNYYTLTNNYYYNCTVNGVNNATNVGHYYGDIPDNNGAVSVHTITLCDGLSITADPSITYDQTDYYAQGTVLALSYDDGKHFLANNVKIEGTTYTMPAEDVIFSPCYLITYNLNGGTLPEGTDNPTSYTSGTLTLPTPKRDYYTFDGWYQGTTKMTSISGITADVTLTAKWTPVEYSIFYNLNGGALPEGTDNPTTFTVESGEITLPNPTRDGCVFGGWYGNEDFEGDAITTINSADATDFYLYAKWNIQEITEIRTTDDLKKFSASVNAGNDYEGKTVKLMNDIDFNPQTGEDNNFTAIGYDAHPFNGTFDGGNHSISGIRIYDNDGGLFGYLDGTVQDVKLANTKIIAQSVGGIAVFNNGTIKNCSVAKDVIETPYSDNSIVGGIACYNRGTVSNCISSASITDGYMVGGIVAVNFGTIKNNLVIGAAISGKELNGAIIGAIESNDVTIQNNFYYNCTVNGVNNATNVGYYNGDITKNNGAVHLDLIIDGDSESPVAITEAQTGANVLYLRKLKAGVTSTIILPFDFDASSMPGIFYQLTSVNSDDWTAGANKVTGTLSANTPYLFLPNSDIDKTVFTTVTLKPTTNDNSVKIDDHWTFHGVYEKILWEAAPKNHYGFSAVANGDNIAAGDFVRIGKFVRIKPTRAYLTYNGGISKSAIVLPDRIQVIFIDKETASVIDPIDTPTDDPTEDITTPVSELPAQASNVKVWSYEKTIYIQSAPDIDYRIIDATGRVLRSATTQTDRDEIRLGHHSGIVIVIINNKTYKINY